MIAVRIAWGRGFEVHLAGGADVALPLADVMRQVAAGRIDGAFTVGSADTVAIPYAEVTEIAMTCSK